MGVWTEVLFDRGLPDGWEPSLVDTKGDVPNFARGLDRLRPSQFRRWARILRDTQRALRREHPHVVHINSNAKSAGFVRDGLVATLVRRHGVPYVMHYHGSISILEDAPVNGWRRRLLRRIGGRAACNIVLNLRDKAFVEAELGGRSRVELVPNYFDERRIHGATPSRLAPGARPRAVFVGGITHGKGAHDVIAAAAALPEMDFLLLGLPYAETEEAVRNATDNVSVPGEVTFDGVMAALRESQVFVLPSRTEGFPMSVCEAMASALPVVASPVGAIGEMVDDGVGGILLRDFEVETLVQALRDVVSDESRRQAMGQHNVDKAEARYAYPSVAPTLARIYAEAVAGR
jgi:glycosyltransferase involved in cell wall biosynthesis